MSIVHRFTENQSIVDQRGCAVGRRARIRDIDSAAVGFWTARSAHHLFEIQVFEIQAVRGECSLDETRSARLHNAGRDLREGPSPRPGPRYRLEPLRSLPCWEFSGGL